MFNSFIKIFGSCQKIYRLRQFRKNDPRQPHYATDIFQQIDEIGDEELILLSLDLQNILGLLKLPEIEKDTVHESSKEKYVFGARG